MDGSEDEVVEDDDVIMEGDDVVDGPEDEVVEDEVIPKSEGAAQRWIDWIKGWIGS